MADDDDFVKTISIDLKQDDIANIPIKDILEQLKNVAIKIQNSNKLKDLNIPAYPFIQKFEHVQDDKWHADILLEFLQLCIYLSTSFQLEMTNHLLLTFNHCQCSQQLITNLKGEDVQHEEKYEKKYKLKNFDLEDYKPHFGNGFNFEVGKEIQKDCVNYYLNVRNILLINDHGDIKKITADLKNGGDDLVSHCKAMRSFAEDLPNKKNIRNKIVFDCAQTLFNLVAWSTHVEKGYSNKPGKPTIIDNVYFAKILKCFYQTCLYLCDDFEQDMICTLLYQFNNQFGKNC